MAIEKCKLEDGLSPFALANIVQNQITKYDNIEMYCVRHGKSVKYYMIKEDGYPFLQYIGYTEKEHNEEDMLQIIFSFCSLSIDTEYLKSNTQVKFI